MRFFLIAFLVSWSARLHAQTTCTAAGQNPSTAFPVCGTSVFVQTSVPLCGGRPLPFSGCRNDGLRDVNPFWYKFTCFQSGTLGFLITPNNLQSDYDWELYDVTGRNPDDVYLDGNLVVSNNWSGERGLTGASSAGTETFVCGGGGKPLFSRMPQLQAGRNYILLVSHFTNSQSGYRLSFGGGTAVITDPVDPRMQKVEASCGGDLLNLRLNKKIRCNSLSPNGSEFYITPVGSSVTGSTGTSCSTQFDTDSIQIKLASPLAPGNYTLHIKKGGDNNTLLDYCDQAIPETDLLNFTVLPRAPTPMDSLAALACAPSQLKLIFKNPIRCSTISTDGSEFTLSGSYPVSVLSASGGCTTGTTKEILVNLSKPLEVSGNFQLVLKTGIDGNTLLDECGEETLPGSSLSFSVKDTVNADFQYNIAYGCVRDTVRFFHNGLNGISNWQWNLEEGQQSTSQTAQAIYTVFNNKNARLIVSNGQCRDTMEKTIVLDNYLEAGFSVAEDNCPSEPITFTSSAKGKIVSHQWEFGDGTTNMAASPVHLYGAPAQQTPFSVIYTVTDSFGCQKSAQKRITIFPSCYLAVPTAFTPNNDGKNDVFGVANAVKAENLQLSVFNRWGQLVFKTTNWKQTWDGKVNGVVAPTSVFVWSLRYTDRDTKKKVEQKGTVTLIR